MFSRKRRTAAGAVVSDRDSSRADVKALKAFAASRRGVEAFLEPQTSVTQTTVVFVAHDGEWTRKRVASPQVAAKLARDLRIPIYDANLTGYPERMREYNLRSAKSAASSARAAAAVPKPSMSREQMNALMVLETYAGVEPLGDRPDQAALTKVWKGARAATHPDRNGGERRKWDEVEKAARVLALS